MKPAYTPYDGSSTPFTIGLKPMDLSTWIEVDAHREVYLTEKRRLYATVPERVFVEQADTRKAQQEVLDLLEAHMQVHFPGLIAAGEGQSADQPPLIAASLLVQEDLILMRKGDDGWRLAAGSLCFPSSWSLVEKFGRPMNAIHEPVPGFGPGTRNADLIERMFDRLQGQAVERMNWSVQAGGSLYHPLSGIQRVERAQTRPSKFPDGDIDAHAFIRVERQTLRKLPASGDILFTIRIYLDPLRVLMRQPDNATLAGQLADQLAAMDQGQLDYKGLSADRDLMVAMLRNAAAGA